MRGVGQTDTPTTKNIDMIEIREMLQAKDKAGFHKLLSWRAVANIYRLMSLGLENEVTIEDAKGYTKVALVFISALLIGGWMEGGAA